MSNIKILDCTLRDGGYINDWDFGYKNIKSILSRLTKANVDVIECGFLEDVQYNTDCSFFSDVDQIGKILPANKGQTEYVAMTRYGCLDINNLKDYDGKSIEGIRVTFHDNEVEEALEFCKLVQDKGYKVYVQPVGTTSYSDSYLLKLIELVNNLKPYAFYIVDTLGLMKKNDLLRMFYLVDNNLDKDIIIGFHSHNNLQLSFSNAQELIDLHSKRVITIDSSVKGMGRGAGNLNTELITQHLNMINETNYKIDYLLEIIDEIIIPIKQKFNWGYSVPYYLAAINNCHPNYASYLMNRKTLPIKSISNILKNVDPNKSELYDEAYISELYMQYQMHQIDDSLILEKLGNTIRNKNILILAPGNSLRREQHKIESYIRDHSPIVIAVNFDGDDLNSDFCFFSNDKRYQNFIDSVNGLASSYNLVVTSNIKERKEYADFMVNYSDLLNDTPLVNDNATLMLLKLLKLLEVNRVAIAGFDGFSEHKSENYAEEEMETGLDNDVLKEMNSQIKKVVEDYNNKLDIQFITESLYRPILSRN